MQIHACTSVGDASALYADIFVLPGQVKEGPLVLEIYQKPIDPRRKRIRYVVMALLPVTIRSVARLHVTRVLLLLCWR